MSIENSCRMSSFSRALNHTSRVLLFSQFIPISVQAGGCLNGNQHLQIGGLMGTEGKQKLVNAMGTVKGKPPKRKRGEENGDPNKIPKEVTPKTPLERAVALQNQVLTKANACRDHAFKLKPLAMSGTLIDQLRALDTKLQSIADNIQSLISKKKNKHHHYVDVIKAVSW